MAANFTEAVPLYDDFQVILVRRFANLSTREIVLPAPDLTMT